MTKLFGKLILICFAISIVIPLLWVVMNSFKDNDSIFNETWRLPQYPRFSNFRAAWIDGSIGQNFLNSIIVTLGTLAILIPLGSMAAYVLVKYPFRGSKVILSTFMGGLMFPNFLVVIPLYLLVARLGLLNTKLGLILVYVAYSLAFTVFVLSGFFQNLPNELVEASMLDGCTHAEAFWKVMLPLAKPGVLVVAIFNAIGLWNEYPLALVLAGDSSSQTLPIGIANLTTNQQYSGDFGAMFAGIVIVMTPVMAVYLIFKDQIQKTMLAGAIKG